MFNQLKNLLFSFAAVATVALFTMAAKPVENVLMKASCSSEKALVSDLSVTITSSTSVSLSWSSWTGAGDYTVTVTNLTTSQREQQFTTSSTSTSVISLTPSNTYRFSVEKAAYIITEEVVM